MSAARALRPQNSIWPQEPRRNPDWIGQHTGLEGLSCADRGALDRLAEAYPGYEEVAISRSQAAKILGISDGKAAASRLKRLCVAGFGEEVTSGSRGRGIAGQWIIDFRQVRKMGHIAQLKMGDSTHFEKSMPENSQKKGVIAPLQVRTSSNSLLKKTEKKNTPPARLYPDELRPRPADGRAGGWEGEQDGPEEILPEEDRLWLRITPEIEAWIGDEGATYQAKRIREACLLSPEEAWMTFEALRVGTKGWSKRGSAVGALLRAMGAKGEDARQESAKSWSTAIRKTCLTFQKAGWTEEPADGTPLASQERQKASLNGYRRLPLGQDGLEARKHLLEASRARGEAPVRGGKTPGAPLTVDPEAMAIWERFLNAASDCMYEASFREWLKPCRPLRFSPESKTLWIGAPSEAAMLWISQSLEEEVNQAREAAGMMDLNLEFEVVTC